MFYSWNLASNRTVIPAITMNDSDTDTNSSDGDGEVVMLSESECIGKHSDLGECERMMFFTMQTLSFPHRVTKMSL